MKLSDIGINTGASIMSNLVRHRCMQKCLGVPHKRMVAEKFMAVLEMIFWQDFASGQYRHG